MSMDIYLRGPEPEDLDVMLAIENDPDLWAHGNGNTGPYTRYQMKQYIASNTNDIYTDRQLRLMIISSSAGNVAGIIDVFDFDVRNSKAEVGIVVLPEFRGMGVAQNALRLMEEHCFGFLGINQLYAYIRSDNKAARKVFLSCGFTETAVLKSWIRLGQQYYDVCMYQKIAKL